MYSISKEHLEPYDQTLLVSKRLGNKAEDFLNV